MSSRKIEFFDGFLSETTPTTEISQGPKGDTGFSILTGEGVPTSELGNVGDKYIDLINAKIYEKEESGWNSGIYLLDALTQNQAYKEKLNITVDASAPTLTLPNSGSYVVGKERLDTYLNGMLLEDGGDYNEVGISGATSTQIEMVIDLKAGDIIMFKVK